MPDFKVLYGLNLNKIYVFSSCLEEITDYEQWQRQYQ